jgi:sugar/nucleoside kinase (ribokinase family)
MIDICCVGHITSDKVVTTKSTMHMAGGTAWYFSFAICKLDVQYSLVTALGKDELSYVKDLQNKGIEVHVQDSEHTVYFENIYSEDQDHRTQNVLEEADPFTEEILKHIEAKIFHLGPLLSSDISLSLIKNLASKGEVSLDIQGYLRLVKDKKVYTTDWPDKIEALKYVKILKTDEAELMALTGCADIKKSARMVADWGVKEVVITNGSHGSTIYCDHIFHPIPAFRPEVIVDATGCGDTYMAGYLYQRNKGADYEESGRFAAALASLKMESAGPFTGTIEDVYLLLDKHKSA